jgi:hypothetical protein
MVSVRSISLLASALCASLLAPLAQAVTLPLQQSIESRAPSSSYWVANVKRQGSVWGNSDSNYQVFRNVMDPKYGAKGDGVTDDTDAINRAISDGNRCGQGCQSSTTTPALVYFPAGTYLVSKPIQMYYYTQMVGDATNLPVIRASSSFSGMAVMDSDPYGEGGVNWFVNQNNFFRQVRNFVIDLTGAPNAAAGIHWQVAQATSLQNMHFKMTPGSQQLGIFMDNGSGGWFSDLLFTGGKFGAFLGSQQFTSRNLTFDGCSTAVYMNWNWGWVLSGLTVRNANIAVDMSNSQSVGSVIISDSNFGNSNIGVSSAYKTSGNNPATGGTLIIDNVDMSSVGTPVMGPNNTPFLSNRGKINYWASGDGYSKTATGSPSQGQISSAPSKNAALLDSNGKIFSRSKPQYEGVSASSILSAKANGCKGDGNTIDTAAIQAFLNKVASTSGAVAYFDHGAYLVDDTIRVPANIKITGEIWPLIVAKGSSFSDASNPKPVFQVGQPGESGSVEITDMLFSTNGPAPGAVMIQWNLKSSQGASGMWDAHVRIGGSYGSNLQTGNCPKYGTPQKQCAGVFLMFDAAPSSGGVYLENTWFWVADHDMEIQAQTQTSIYSARGALFRSTNGPTWLWGTASEHSMFYNYQFSGISAANGIFGGFMQTETPYFQPNPTSLGLSWLPTNSAYDDPSFANCKSGSSSAPCEEAWGLRVVNSKSVLLYAVGMYNFFNGYNQDCVKNNNCQQNMISLENSQVAMYAVTTKAAVNMISDTAFPNRAILDSSHRNNFGATLAYYINY